MATFERTVTVNASPEQLFDFHTDTGNLVRISPPWFKATVLKDEGVGQQRTVELRVSALGIPTRWQVNIAQFDRPRMLADLVTRGPFKYFHHRRSFRAVGAGTALTDTVEYTLPFGAIGRLADRMIVRHLIAGMFSYRHKRTKEIFDHAA